MKIVAFGGWFGSGNVGDDAILMGFNNLVKRISPDCDVTALSTDPAQTRRVCGVPAVELVNPRSAFTRGVRYLSTMLSADAAVMTGGTPFYDWDHLSRLLYGSVPLILGMPLACFGVGSKAISSLVGRKVSRLLLRHAARVSARDRASQARLAELGGVKVSLTGDSALFLEPGPTDMGKKLIESVGIEAGRVAIVCPRALSTSHRIHYHDPLDEETVNTVRLGVARACDQLWASGFSVILVPLHRSRSDNDLDEIREVLRLVEGPRPSVLDGPLKPTEAMSLLGEADVVVGLRLHSLILAASMGTPAVSVGYDEKVGGFMELAGTKELLVEPGDLGAAAVRAAGDRDELGDLLRASCEEQRGRILLEARRLLEELG